MIVDYEVNPSMIPNAKQSFLIASYLEGAGYVIKDKEMNQIRRGLIQYKRGTARKLCKDCFDYLPFEEFGARKKDAFGITDLCKRCRNGRDRKRKYAVPKLITDTGFVNRPLHYGVILQGDNLKIINECNKQKEEV